MFSWHTESKLSSALSISRCQRLILRAGFSELLERRANADWLESIHKRVIPRELFDRRISRANGFAFVACCSARSYYNIDHEFLSHTYFPMKKVADVLLGLQETVRAPYREPAILHQLMQDAFSIVRELVLIGLGLSGKLTQMMSRHVTWDPRPLYCQLTVFKGNIIQNPKRQKIPITRSLAELLTSIRAPYHDSV